MEQRKNNKNIIILIIIAVVILLLLAVLLFSGIMRIKSNSNNEIDDNVYNERAYDENEQMGLELYKYFTGDGNGPFKWDDNTVINYDEVISKMTDSYKKSFEDNDNGFSIPINENGIWKNYGGRGTTRESKFKDIKVTLIDSCKIRYEIIYTYFIMSDVNKKQYEDVNQFVVKTNSCSQDDPDTDFSNGYKVDSFRLVYGLKFE